MKQNRLEFFKQLGVAPNTILITDIILSMFGSVCQFACVYDADNPKRFDILFHGIHSANWFFFNEGDQRNTTADVIGIHIDTLNNRASIATDLFEVVLEYRHAHIEKTW